MPYSVGERILLAGNADGECQREREHTVERCPGLCDDNLDMDRRLLGFGSDVDARGGDERHVRLCVACVCEGVTSGCT